MDFILLILNSIKKLPSDSMINKICFPLFMLKTSFKGDVFYFRIQIYVIALCLIAPWFLINSLIVTLFKIPQNWLSYFFFTSSAYQEFLFVFATCLFLTIISIINFIIKSRRNNVYDNAMQDIFANEKNLWEFFTEFSIEEFSLENVKVFEDIQKYKTLNDDEKKSFVELMKYNYFTSESPLEINLPIQSKKKFLDNIEKEILNFDLDKVEKDVIYNLSDTWSRFIISKEYQNYIVRKTIVK